MTETMIAMSYGRLKQSVVRVPSQALGSMGDTVKKHPFAAAAVAVGAGITLYGIFRMMNRQRTPRERRAGGRERSAGPDMAMEIFSMLLPIIKPYITGYLEKYLGKIFSKDHP